MEPLIGSRQVLSHATVRSIEKLLYDLVYPSLSSFVNSISYDIEVKQFGEKKINRASVCLFFQVLIANYAFFSNIFHSTKHR